MVVILTEKSNYPVNSDIYLQGQSRWLDVPCRGHAYKSTSDSTQRPRQRISTAPCTVDSTLNV